MTTPSSGLEISPQEQAILEHIHLRQDDMLSTLIRWSDVNSGSYHQDGLVAMRSHLLEALSDLPGQVKTIELMPSEAVTPFGEKQMIQYQAALQIDVRPKAPIQVVLTGHYDTVFPKSSHFQSTRRINDDTLGGPGVADMKGGILVMIEALKAFETHPNATNIGYSILLSPDEEIGSPGSAPRLMELGRKSHIGLTYEPSLSDGSLAGARKGSGNFAVIIRGKAAHAGRDHHLGRNAIAEMARFIAKLDDLNGQREGVTFNIAKIDGGGAVNVVPDLAIGRFNVRMLIPDDMDWIEQAIQKLLQQTNSRDGVSAELTGGFTRPPKPMAPANALVFDWVKRAGGALGQTIRWNPSGGVCEGNNLWASGCPNVDTLGVIGGHIHSDQEFMKISSLVSRAQLSALILMKIATGEFNAQMAKDLAIHGSNPAEDIC